LREDTTNQILYGKATSFKHHKQAEITSILASQTGQTDAMQATPSFQLITNINATTNKHKHWNPYLWP
jgi:hypothetical protein